MVKDYVVTSEEFLEAIKNCQNRNDLGELRDLLLRNDEVKMYNMYASSVKLNWTIFYEAYRKERELSSGHYLAAIIAMNLEQPLIGKAWTKAPVDGRVSIEDFQQELMLQMATDYLGKWSMDQNDNFHAYFQSWILPTVFNEVTKGEISDYIKKTYGYSLTSINQMNDALEMGFDIADETVNVEKKAIDKVDRNKLLDGVLNLPEDVQNSLIKVAVFIKKMQDSLSGFSEEEIEAFTQVIEEHNRQVELGLDK